MAEVLKNEKNNSILKIEDLKVMFSIRKNWVSAVDGVSFDIKQGEIIGVVGESGSGKSVMSQAIIRLKEHDTAIKYEGKILFDGKDLLKIPLKEMGDIRGNNISIIFQDPLNSLSPVHTVGKQLSEIIMLHKGVSKEEAKKQSIEMLKLTGISGAQQCMNKYPFELSGGMQQRIMIAMALACEPKLLIADEPTTALDVTIQEQILKLILELNKKIGMAVLFITHDMGVVSKLCHSVKVMYLGQVVEDAKTKDLFSNPLHPYTKGLLTCIPHLGVEKGEELPTIQGTVPPLSKIPKGCHFCTRCKEVKKICIDSEPPVMEIEKGHKVKCWKYTVNYCEEGEV